MSCPGCDRDDGVEETGAGAGRCSHCGMSWATSVVNPRPPLFSDRVAGMAVEIGRLRGALRQVIALAEEAPGLTDVQLRERLVALADQVRPEERS